MTTPTSTLTSSQRKVLRGLSHDLKPVVHIGQKGLSDNVLDELRVALDAHELIKVKLAGERDERQTLAATIAQYLGAEIAGLVGKVGIFYRPQQDASRRRVKLPS